MGADVTIRNQPVAWVPETVRISKNKSRRHTCDFHVLDFNLGEYPNGDPVIPETGAVVGVYDWGKRIFGGTITQIHISPDWDAAGAPTKYEVTAASWEGKLESRYVGAASFYEMSAGEIMAEVLGTYAEGEVHVGPPGDIQFGASADLLKVVIYRGTNVAGIADDLAERSGYVWYCDPDGYFYFVPKEYIHANVSVETVNSNYRDPSVEQDLTEYFNKATMAISYEAFAPEVYDVTGDQTYPFYDIPDPNNPNEFIPIDVIKSIELNGILKSIVIKDSGTEADLYYTPGSPRIEWDPAIPSPTAADIVRYTIYRIGANVLSVDDGEEIAAVRARETGAGSGSGSGSGIKEAYMEDFDVTSADAALERLNRFLDAHCPHRSDSSILPGEPPTQYHWVMYSHELISDDAQSIYVEDLLPGRIIHFAPTSPGGISKDVLVDSVEISDVTARPPASIQVPAEQREDMLLYRVTGIDVPTIQGAMGLYEALAEVGPSLGAVVRPPDEELYRLTATLGFSGILEVMDWYSDIEITIPPLLVARCGSVRGNVTGPPVGASILVDLEYSTDGGGSWLPMLASSSGNFVIEDGQRRGAALGIFAPFPDPLDLSDRFIVRGNIKQVGSTDPGSDLKVQLILSVRRA